MALRLPDPSCSRRSAIRVSTSASPHAGCWQTRTLILGRSFRCSRRPRMTRRSILATRQLASWGEFLHARPARLVQHPAVRQARPCRSGASASQSSTACSRTGSTTYEPPRLNRWAMLASTPRWPPSWSPRLATRIGTCGWRSRGACCESTVRAIARPPASSPAWYASVSRWAIDHRRSAC